MNAAIKYWLGPVLVLLLVAGTSYILGRQSRPAEELVVAASSTVANPTVTVNVAPAPNTSANVIDDIQQSLAQVAAPTTATSGAKAPSVAATDQLININTAGIAELDKLPGIGPKYAQAIIDYRNQNGPFVRIDDLVKVKGIGPKTLEKLRSLVTI